MDGRTTMDGNNESSSPLTQSTAVTASSFHPTAPSATIKDKNNCASDSVIIAERVEVLNGTDSPASTEQCSNIIDSSQCYLLPVPRDADNLVKVYRHKKDVYKCVFPFACQAFADLRPLFFHCL